MGLFDAFRKKKEEPKKEENNNTIKLLFIRDYNDYKAGQIVEIDTAMANYLTRGGYVSTNLNANVEEERKRVDDELYRKQMETTAKIINDRYNEHEKSIQENYRIMSDISSRLGGTFPSRTDPGVEMARRLLKEREEKEKNSSPIAYSSSNIEMTRKEVEKKLERQTTSSTNTYIGPGVEMARRLLKEIEEEQKQDELNQMFNVKEVDSTEKETSNIK